MSMIGNRIGPYRVMALLGEGGMGEVYRADDLKLEQPVALKFLPTALNRDQALLKALYNEVRAARRVSHRHVCRVYDIGGCGWAALPLDGIYRGRGPGISASSDWAAAG